MGDGEATLPHLDAKYRVLAQLGQGGTAEVSLAVARGPSGFSKLVVLKALKGSLQAEPEFAEMFLSEARLAARLNHPNIAQTLEVIEVDGLPVIVMEYLEGQPLAAVLERAAGEGKPAPLALQVRVICDVLAGLHHSHELCDFDGSFLGVVHRDVGPQNVFVTFEGQVKVLDFGIAKLADSRAETATGVLKGKLSYMPAEQIEGERVDRRADLYAVGVMLWEAAVGRRMWESLSEAAILNHVVNGEVPSARSVNPAVDADLEALISRALSLEPDARFQTAEDMQLALEELAARKGWDVRSREVGAYVAGLFDNVRRHTRAAVDAQLQRAAQLTDFEYAGLAALELAAFHSSTGLSRPSEGSASFTGSGLGGFSGGVVGDGRVVAEPSRRGGARGAAIALAVLLPSLAAVATWLYFARAPHPELVTMLPATPAAAETAPAAEVRLRVTAFPATARLSLDGEPLPSNPFSRTFEPGDQVRTLRVEADGYLAQERSVQLDADREFVITLLPDPSAAGAAASSPSASKGAGERERAPRASAPRVQPSSHSSGAVSRPKAAAQGDDCAVPFTIDQRGIKKFKPQCL